MQNTKLPSVLHIITSHAWGGLELYVVTLVKKLIDSGYKSSIYCIKNSKIDCEAKKLGLSVFYGHKQARISIKDILQVKKIIQLEKFNVIHVHTRQDVWLGSLAKKNTKLIYSLYMSASPKKDIFHAFIYKRIDVLISSSQTLNEKIKKNYPVPATRVHLLRYGREQDNFEKNRGEVLFLRKLWNTKQDALVFATMCRLDSAKGVREIAESILYLKNDLQKKIKIWIMGEPTLLYTNEYGQPVHEQQSLELYNWLKNFADNHKEIIELIPFQKNIRPYLEAMDVFILATYKETYSLSILDAMSVGAPVIGTNSGGSPEQVKHLERGYLIEAKSPQSVAEAIEYYVENKDAINVHGKAARQWVKQEHDWQKTLKELHQLYFIF